MYVFFRFKASFLNWPSFFLGGYYTGVAIHTVSSVSASKWTLEGFTVRSLIVPRIVGGLTCKVICNQVQKQK